MEKRINGVFACILVGLFFCELVVYNISSSLELRSAAEQQSTWALQLPAGRGTIYDYKLRPLTNRKNRYLAAVSPSGEALQRMRKLLSPEELQEYMPLFQKGKPFLLELSQNAESTDAFRVFAVPDRYEKDQIASHVIGYINGEGEGVSGAEKAYDDVLSRGTESITLEYQVDALCRPLLGNAVQTKEHSSSSSGIVLSLDTDIQKIAEEAAEKYLKSGAVVVAEIPTCALRAVVSLPDFSPKDPTASLDGENSPFVNKAFSAYNAGSVFKLVSAAAALEYGFLPETSYTCEGALQVGSGEFHCFNSNIHGECDLRHAVAFSCNTYFIRLMQGIPPENFREMMVRFGFGCPLELMPGVFAAAGTLPSLQTLQLPKGLANAAFGQGELAVTPVQITAMVNAIASGGIYTEPSLFAGKVNAECAYIETADFHQGVQIISTETAAVLREAMIASAEVGTGCSENPIDAGGAGVKTATAQTGWYKENGEEVLQCWYVGFWPKESPQYVITVFAEDGTGGGSTCGPVFREVAEGLFQMNPRWIEETT